METTTSPLIDDGLTRHQKSRLATTSTRTKIILDSPAMKKGRKNVGEGQQREWRLPLL